MFPSGFDPRQNQANGTSAATKPANCNWWVVRSRTPSGDTPFVPFPIHPDQSRGALDGYIELVSGPFDAYATAENKARVLNARHEFEVQEERRQRDRANALKAQARPTASIFSGEVRTLADFLGWRDTVDAVKKAVHQDGITLGPDLDLALEHVQARMNARVISTLRKLAPRRAVLVLKGKDGYLFLPPDHDTHTSALFPVEMVEASKVALEP